MTEQKDIINDPKYIPILDYGFVGLIDAMPCENGDAAIVQAARVSYGNGTKSLRDDENLIRYLMRNDHTSPFEMVEYKFHIKIPIFVCRQLIRHRTANVNEYSGRYSIMSEEFYIPKSENIAFQKKTNKQGRETAVNKKDAETIRNLMISVFDNCYNLYKTLLGKNEKIKIFKDEKINNNGISRELARIILPVSNYTELYFKIDLKNLLHFLSLRTSPHAQYEIRILANSMLQLIENHVPLTIKAWKDYKVNSVSLSKQEIDILASLFPEDYNFDILFNSIENNKSLSKGEKLEFKNKIKKIFNINEQKG